MQQHTAQQEAPRFPQATEIVVDLRGPEGNAFGIIAEGRRVLRAAGATDAEVKEYLDDATSNSYDHLLEVTKAWVPVTLVDE